jgi:hypothetical protein
MEDQDYTDKNGLFSKSVRAGKRTYFFDVRSTKGNDYYLTITESKKRFHDDGSYEYQKHKIFLYKEDFEKFGEALSESFKQIIEYQKNIDEQQSQDFDEKFSDINFDDLA